MAEAELMMLSEIVDKLDNLQNQSGSQDRPDLICRIEEQAEQIALLKQSLEELQKQNEELLTLEENAQQLKAENFLLNDKLSKKDTVIYRLRQENENLSKALSLVDKVDFNTLSNNLNAASNEAARVINTMSGVPTIITANWLVMGVIAVLLVGGMYFINSNVKEAKNSLNNVYWGIYTKPTPDSPSHSAISWSYSWQLEQERRDKFE